MDQAGSSTGSSSVGVHDRPNFKKGNDRNSQRERTPCGKCGHSHGGDCMISSNACYGCDKSGHMIWDCQHVKNQAKADTHPQRNSTAAAEPPKSYRFYYLKGRKEQQKSANVVTSNLHVFSFPVYALFDHGSTLSFVTPLVSSKLDLIREIWHEAFLVSTPIGDMSRAERVYRDRQ